MTQFSPLVNSINQSGVVQRQQSVSKAQQIQRAQQLAKNVAAEDDQLETQVENSEELTAVRPEHDSDQHSRRQGQEQDEKQDGEDEKPTLDLTA